MAAESSVDAAASNLNLTPEEKRAYGQLFRQADTDNVGVVTGDVAVKFFEKTRLDSRILGEIWQVADTENRGFLTPAGFGLVLRLIGHAQHGREPTHELALQPGPLPRFEGINLGGMAPPTSPTPLQAQGSGSVPIRIPPLTPEKVSQYSNLFERQNLQNGTMLPGDQAKNIFEKSGLPNEVLGRIWQLADTEQRGALVMAEFVIAMHLLTSMKSGALRGLPNILPAPLYEAATRRGSVSRQSPTTTVPPIPPVPAIPRQLSGPAQVRTSSPLGRPPLGPQATGLAPQVTGIAPQTTGGDWLVTPADKARFDQFFADLDKANKGFITGEEAVPFLSQSSLTEDALAQIWDLADINSEGRLTKDTFAVAMYLIRQQRSRRDLPLPATLPPNLIPPSLRSQPRPPPGPSPFDVPAPVPPQPPPPQPQPKSALDDLFGLDAPPSPAPPQAPLSPAGSATARDPFAASVPPGSPSRASPTANTFKPFVPSSSFGKTLTAHDTGGSGSSAQAHKSPPPSSAGAMEDLLGDNDPEISKKLTNETAELANLSNQVGSLSKQMQQVQGQRSSTQNEINRASEQKKNFEQRLSQLRTLYEKEAKDVRTLEEQLKNIREETRKLTNEMVTIDGTYQDLQNQHRQILQALQADQQENTSLKQRISSINTEVAQLKPQIEKLKSEARQQKGLVAINKKQLSTSEGERDKLRTEVDDLTKSNEEMSRQINASSPTTTSAQVVSPAPSTTSANNPFFRRTGSTDIMGAFSAPPVKSYGDRSFNDIFGEFGADNASGTPPPSTMFKQPGADASAASVGSFGTAGGSTTTGSRQVTMNTESSESRPTTSSFPPFGEASESRSSSRQVSPPVSRGGESTATPSTSTPAPAPVEPAHTGQSTTSVADNNQKWSSGQGEEKSSAPTNGSIPGAFPEEIQSTTAPTTTFAGNRDSDLFANMKDAGNAKVDFESAFASMGGSSNKTQDKSAKDNSNAFTGFNTEFPPISELERDDDSESASEGNRFDDDFAPASPSTTKAERKEAPQAPSSPQTAKTTAAGPDASAETVVATSHAPQPSNDLSAFPEPPKASPSFSSPSKADDPFVPTPTTVTSAAPVAPKGAFDDLDDDFEGLEDAKEGSAEDEFANISISRSNIDDFNAVFDSSPPPSQPKSESTNVSNAFGVDSSYDFATVSTTSATTAGGTGATSTSNANQAPGSSHAPTAADNHDWEALFSSLDSPTEATARNSEENKSPGQSQSASRPSNLGRALTDEGKHDDPIVKNLTGMGYSRADAINALEKYDYNLERVR
ncbi:hypothetical protein F4779DRAFT_171416 [Xylariaceae sp. FL0662B]|nr:hypothetical protein F4779DRAFT_171416 [Xylariaceae sp. FL0662B]